MFKIKGSALIISIEIAKKHSQDSYEKIVARLGLGPSGRNILPYKWYEVPCGEKNNFINSLATEMFPGDPLAVRKLGELQVSEGTKEYHRFFLRVASPKIVFARAIKMWETFYDKGEFELESINNKTAIFHIRKFPEMPQYLREIIYGNLSGLGILLRRPITIDPEDTNPEDYRWKITWV
ncbi:hypothetical protein JW933_01305 [candidate division FCPU426 bacterium]|nr:hypothetical protein [candidate division FCPU426 bacterium]